MKKIHQLEEQLHGEMQLKDELEQKCRYGQCHRTKNNLNNLDMYAVLKVLAVFVHCRASNTKLDKIMKELDEEVELYSNL